MNSSLIKILFILCGFFSVILFIEWQVLELFQSEQVEVTKVPVEQKLELAEISLSNKTIDGYSTIVEKPLFIEGRRPVSEEDEQVLNKKTGEISDLTLVGIYSFEGQMYAMFNTPKAEKKHEKKAEGDEVTGWVISSILKDRVILDSGEQQKTILLRKPKAKKKSKLKPRDRQKIKLKS